MIFSISTDWAEFCLTQTKIIYQILPSKKLMKNLNLQIEELNNLSKIITVGSPQDVNNFTAVISSFFWRFNLKSYAYFEELFKEFAEVNKLLETLLLLDKIGDIIKHDQHISRYILLLELIEITEETYCAKAVINPIVKRLSALIKKPGLTATPVTIREFLELYTTGDDENLQVGYQGGNEEGTDLLKKLQASEKQIKKLSEELAHNSDLTTKKGKFNGTIKHLQKQVRWFEQSVLEEAIKIYRRYCDLKKELDLKNDKLHSIEKKNATLKQNITTLKDKLKQQTATISQLEKDNVQLKKQTVKKEKPIKIRSVKAACEILEMDSSKKPGARMVKKRYKELAQKWHPDLYIRNVSRYQLATEIFQEINEAKEYLCSSN